MRRTRVRASTAAMLARRASTARSRARASGWPRPLCGWRLLPALASSEASAPLSTATGPFLLPTTFHLHSHALYHAVHAHTQYTHSDSWGHVRHLCGCFNAAVIGTRATPTLPRFRPRSSSSMEKILAGRLRSTDPMAPSVDSAFSTRAGRAAAPTANDRSFAWTSIAMFSLGGVLLKRY